MAVKAKQNIKLKINQKLLQFLREHLGEETKDVVSEVVEDVIIVRFKGVLSLAEKHLSKDLQGAKLIQELKVKLIEKVKPALKLYIEEITGAKVIDVYSSFNLATGERIEVLTLNKSV